MIKKLIQLIITGFLSLLPIILTIWILTTALKFLDGILGGFVRNISGLNIPGLGIISILLLSLLAGIISKYLLARKIILYLENLLYSLPFVNTVYDAAKKIKHLFFPKNKTIGKKVCLVEYPRKGIFSIGFVTNYAPKEINSKKNAHSVIIFIPSTPTPATGFTIIVPEKEITYLDLSVEEAIKLVISGGTLSK